MHINSYLVGSKHTTYIFKNTSVLALVLNVDKTSLSLGFFSIIVQMTHRGQAQYF